MHNKKCQARIAAYLPSEIIVTRKSFLFTSWFLSLPYSLAVQCMFVKFGYISLEFGLPFFFTQISHSHFLHINQLFLLKQQLQQQSGRPCLICVLTIFLTSLWLLFGLKVCGITLLDHCLPNGLNFGLRFNGLMF